MSQGMVLLICIYVRTNRVATISSHVLYDLNLTLEIAGLYAPWSTPCLTYYKHFIKTAYRSINFVCSFMIMSVYTIVIIY